MNSPAVQLLADQVDTLTAECRRLAAENELLWRSYELHIGNPYQHLRNPIPSHLVAGILETEGDQRWGRELDEVTEQLRPGHFVRRCTGLSAWCDHDQALAGRDAPRPSRPSISPALRLAVLERDGYRCVACGAFADLQLDHVIPFSAGGPTNLENLQVMCEPHNRLKGTRSPEEWAPTLARIRAESAIPT